TLANAAGGNNIEINQPSDMDLHVASFTSLSFSEANMNEEPGTTVNVCVDLVNPCSSCDVPTVDVVLQGTGLPHLSQYTTETLTFSNGSLMECFPLVIENDATIGDYTFTLANAAGGNNIGIGQPSDMNLHVAYPPNPSCRIWNEIDWNTMNGSNIVFDSCDVGYATISDNTDYDPVANDQYHLVYTDICGDGEVIARINAAPTNDGYAGIEIREHDGAGAQKVLLLTNYTNDVEVVTRKVGFGLYTDSYTVSIIPKWVKIVRFGVWLTSYVSEDGINWTQVAATPFPGLQNCLVAGLSAHNDGINTTTVNYSNAEIMDGGLPTTKVSFTDAEISVDAGDIVQICLDIFEGCGSCVPVNAEVALTSSNTPHLTTYTNEQIDFGDGSITKCFDLIVDNHVDNGTYTFELQSITGGNNAIAGDIPTLTLNVVGATELSFSSANTIAEPGEIIDVCVSLTNPCVDCSVVTVDVALLGSDSPHLLNYMTRTLDFSGSNIACFPLTIGDDNIAGEYTLILQNATGGNDVTLVDPNSLVIEVVPRTEINFVSTSSDEIPGGTVQICAELIHPCSACDDVTADVVIITNDSPHLTDYSPESFLFDNGSTYECISIDIGNDPSMEAYTLKLENINGGNNTITVDSLFLLNVTPPSSSLSFSSPSFDGTPGETVDLCVDLTNPCTNCGDIMVDVVLISDDSPHLTDYTTYTLTFSNGSTSECVTIPVGNDVSAMSYDFELQNLMGNNNPTLLGSTTVLSIAPSTEVSFALSFVQSLPGETVDIVVDLAHPCSDCADVTVEVVLQGDGIPHIADFSDTTLTFANGSIQEFFSIDIDPQEVSGTYTLILQNVNGGHLVKMATPSEMTIYVQHFTSDDLIGCVLFPDLTHCEIGANPDGTPPAPPYELPCVVPLPDGFTPIPPNPWLCHPDYRYKGIANAEVEVVNLSNPGTANVISDDAGFFGTGMTSGMIQMTPLPFEPHPPGTSEWVKAVNGINALDISKVSDYADGTGELCPLSRIAADVNNDGRVDAADVAKMNDVLLMNDLTFDIPHWRFIPLPYVYPNEGHNDPTFIADFWQDAKNDHRGLQYPFNAILNFNGKSYTYKGDENGNGSWMDMLSEWPYNTPEACGETKWGFYLVKLGETTANAFVSSSTESILSTDIMEFIPESTNRESLPDENPPISFLVRVSAETTDSIPVASYQIGLQIDTSMLNVTEIMPREEVFDQELEKNFCVNPQEWGKGHFRSVWINDFEDNSEGIYMNNKTMLFEFVVSVDVTGIPTPGEVFDAIYTQHGILPTIFYTKDEQIEDVELSIEIFGL
ncbi:MAG: dockerin type I repeat-containing protein, partial [Chitinophagales bacterium]|nr:dockerin type I repeat-containing protein [Chitinophagales bacterium]